MPRLLVEKANLLEQAGYAYNYHRMMYVNRTDRKAFSIEFLDDNPESKIREKIAEPKEADAWEFYTSSDLSEGIRRELNRVLQ
jgi:hypothetical protein